MGMIDKVNWRKILHNRFTMSATEKATKRADLWSSQNGGSQKSDKAKIRPTLPHPSDGYAPPIQRPPSLTLDIPQSLHQTKYIPSRDPHTTTIPFSLSPTSPHPPLLTQQPWQPPLPPPPLLRPHSWEHAFPTSTQTPAASKPDSGSVVRKRPQRRPRSGCPIARYGSREP